MGFLPWEGLPYGIPSGGTFGIISGGGGGGWGGFPCDTGSHLKFGVVLKNAGIFGRDLGANLLLHTSRISHKSCYTKNDYGIKILDPVFEYHVV